MKKSISTGCIILSLLLPGSITKAQDTGTAPSMDRIRRLMNDFQESIVKKDSVRLKALFFDMKTPVIGVMSAATENSIKKTNPDFMGLSVSTGGRFVKEICSTMKKQEERFYNVETDMDSTLAIVSFDYAFISDGKTIQWGLEKWNLVFAENQWLITGINYLIRYQEVEKCPWMKE